MSAVASVITNKLASVSHASSKVRGSSRARKNDPDWSVVVAGASGDRALEALPAGTVAEVDGLRCYRVDPGEDRAVFATVVSTAAEVNDSVIRYG